MATLTVLRAGPLVTVQDAGRFGMLAHGIGASGPMDRGGFARAGALLGRAGRAGLEFTSAGLGFSVDAPVTAGFSGGDFSLAVGGEAMPWNAAHDLAVGVAVEITPGKSGNYGYLRLDREIGVPEVLGSRATNLTVGLGGHEGRALLAGDIIPLIPLVDSLASEPAPPAPGEGPIRVVWGLHADGFAPEIRERFLSQAFVVSSRMDRMGVRLDDPDGVFAGLEVLSLVSDAVVAGDIQILGDGTPIILMRDHQPTGGYPRIATVISADLDRFSQLRPGSSVNFRSISVTHAQKALRGGG